MKKLKSFLLPVTLSIVTTLVACNGMGPDKNKDSKDVAEEHNDAKFDKAQESDAQFMVNAADINMKEIKLSELARSSAVSDDGKKLAEMMISDHQKALDQIQSLASKKGITLPTALSDGDQKDYNNLNDKKGADFDKKYCDLMVDGHKDAIDKFEKAASDAADSDIRSLASGMLPTLRTHLDHALTCQEKCNKM
jgi:putative membrane protein